MTHPSFTSLRHNCLWLFGSADPRPPVQGQGTKLEQAAAGAITGYKLRPLLLAGVVYLFQCAAA